MPHHIHVVYMFTSIHAIGSYLCVPPSTYIYARPRLLERLAANISSSNHTWCAWGGETLIQCATPCTCRCLQVSTPKTSRAFGCEDPHSPTYTSCVWGPRSLYASIYTCVVFEMPCAQSRTGEWYLQNVQVRCASGFILLAMSVA